MTDPTSWLYEMGKQAKSDCAKLGAHSVLVEALLSVVMKHKLLDDFVEASAELSEGGKRLEAMESEIAALKAMHAKDQDTIARLRQQLEAAAPAEDAPSGLGAHGIGP